MKVEITKIGEDKWHITDEKGNGIWGLNAQELLVDIAETIAKEKIGG